SSMVKVLASDLQLHMANLVVDVLGLDGLVHAGDVPLGGLAEQLYRAALFHHLGGGTMEMQLNAIALQSLGLPRGAQGPTVSTGPRRGQGACPPWPGVGTAPSCCIRPRMSSLCHQSTILLSAMRAASGSEAALLDGAVPLGERRRLPVPVWAEALAVGQGDAA